MNEFRCVFKNGAIAKQGTVINTFSMPEDDYAHIKADDYKVYVVALNDIRHIKTIGESNFYMKLDNWSEVYRD